MLRSLKERKRTERSERKKRSAQPRFEGRRAPPSPFPFLLYTYSMTYIFLQSGHLKFKIIYTGTLKYICIWD